MKFYKNHINLKIKTMLLKGSKLPYKNYDELVEYRKNMKINFEIEFI